MLHLRHAFRLAFDLVAYSVINRVGWLLPLMFALFLAALLVTVGQVAAPFLYTIF